MQIKMIIKTLRLVARSKRKLVPSTTSPETQLYHGPMRTLPTSFVPVVKNLKRCDNEYKFYFFPEYPALCKQFAHLYLKVHGVLQSRKNRAYLCITLCNTISSFDLFESRFAVTTSLLMKTFLYVAVLRALKPRCFLPTGVTSATNLSLYKNQMLSLISLNSCISVAL